MDRNQFRILARGLSYSEGENSMSLTNEALNTLFDHVEKSLRNKFVNECSSVINETGWLFVDKSNPKAMRIWVSPDARKQQCIELNKILIKSIYG